MATWTTINNGESLLTIRTQLNSFNSAIAAEVTANTSTIGTNTTAISDLVNITDTNASNINLIDDRVTVIEDNKVYEYTTVSNVTVTDDTYETIDSLTTSNLSAGLYELRMSQLHTLNSTTTSAYFRFSIDGGSNWVEVRRESKDIADIIPMTFWQIIDHPGGVLNIIVQARKEVTGDTLYISNLNIVVEKK